MDQVREAHKSEYGKDPEVVSSTPGRFHLIGEHSWFFKDKTLSMAVDLPVYVALSKREDSSLKFYFSQLDDRRKTSLASLKFRKEDRWANVVKAMIYGFTSGGYEVGGLDVTVYSDNLPSAGFGITTAIKIGSAIAIRELYKFACDDNQLLQAVERGNRLFLGVENYNADNFSALYSKAGSLILTDNTRASYENIPFHFDGKTVLLVDARVPRLSVWNEEVFHQPENVLLIGELKERKDSAYGGWQYEENVTEVNEVLSIVNEETRRRLLCVMREHGCVLEAREALVKGSFGQFARAVNKSHESMRDLYDCSCPEIDWLLKRLGQISPNIDDPRNPTNCGRITGKGFGRCLYAILNTGDVAEFKKKITEYERIFGFKPVCHEVLPAAGARIV